MTALPRSSGVLLHPSSLSSIDGIGDFGPAARQFIEWSVTAKQRFWQVLPLNPVGPGNSPYASPSAFALSHLFISLQDLADERLLDQDYGKRRPGFESMRVDYEKVDQFKSDCLKQAFFRLESGANPTVASDLEKFCREHGAWLNDYALFMALKHEHDDASWQDWELPLRLRQPEALEAAEHRLAEEIRFQKFLQAIAFGQWLRLKQMANDRGMQVIGDIPIFVALDSADVWANQHLFRLNAAAEPEVVSGVPPDLFTDEGQLWGNPVYAWPAHVSSNFAWWISRMKATLNLVDLVRIDHFRGFAAAWVVPARADSAKHGRWEQGPGRLLFEAMEQATGQLPMIAEDLGLITADVHQLRQELSLPGMKVLQFAFGGNADNAYLPHNYLPDCVVYTGTHDNQTTIGWFATQTDSTRRHVRSYVGRDGSDIAWDFVRMALASIANLAVLPAQDILRLDDTARMNAPGSGSGNWEWRLAENQLDFAIADGLATLVEIYGRFETASGARDYDPYDYSAPNTQHRLFD